MVNAAATPASPRALPVPAPGRTLRRVLAALISLLGLVLLATWLIPPRLDWSRFRGPIAAFVSAELGRPVRIAGPIALRLLPEPVFEAGAVTLPDTGDGIAAQVASLRLTLSSVALFGGTLGGSELALERPELRLTQRGIVSALTSARPPLSAGILLRLHDGRVILGGLSLTGLDAGLHVETDTGALAADGAATLAGLRWHAAALIGPHDVRSAAPISLRIDSGKVGRAEFSGHLASLGGVVEGQLSSRGRSLAGRPWTADMLLAARATAATVTLSTATLGDMVGSGTLRVSDAGLDGRLSLHGGDLRALTTLLPYPIHLDIEATDVHLGPRPVSRAAFTLSTHDTGWAIDHATLRTSAFTLTGNGTGNAGKIKATFAVDTPSLREAFAWFDPSLPAALAPGGAAKLTTTIEARDTAWTVLAQGTAGNAPVSLRLAKAEGKLDAMIDGGALRLDTLPETVAWSNAALHLRYDTVLWRTLSFPALSADLAVSPAGIAIHALRSGSLQVSGMLDRDFSLNDVRLAGTWPSLQAIGPLLAEPWRRRVAAAADALPVTVRARLNGPAATPSIDAEGAWGDLRFAASGKADLARAGFDGSVTAFHPNAVRLLGDLGFSGNEWIGPGSFSYCGSLHWAGGGFRLAATNFSAGDAAFSLAGTIDPPAHHFDLALDAVSLPLPAFDGLTTNWWGTLAIRAGALTRDGATVATSLSADLLAGPNTIAAKIAHVTTGAADFAGDIAASFDDPAVALRGTLTHLAVTESGSRDHVRVAGSTLDARVDGFARGADPTLWPQSVTGRLDLSFGPTLVDGFDLNDSTLSAGTSFFASGSASATVADGRLAVTEAALRGPDGDLDLSGTLSLTGGASELSGMLRLPSTQGAIPFHIAGPGDALGAHADVTASRSASSSGGDRPFIAHRHGKPEKPGRRAR